MKTKLIVIGILSLCSVGFYTIKSDFFKYPKYFPVPEYDFTKNPISKNKIILGNALFYDPILSKDNTISCASCHSPYNAFAHTDHKVSHGIQDQIGTRNAPALFNLAWQKSFMWDGAIKHLDMQALAPISDATEMGENIQHVVHKLKQSNIYPKLFQAAYGDRNITGERILKALSQFQLSLISANSKYDKVIQGKEKFTNQENTGYSIFKNKCNSCHAEPMFTNYGFANNGIAVDTIFNDYGRWMVTKQSKDSLAFKIPTLRNLRFSPPYMHDGRFKKLNQVLNHYTSEKNQSKTLAAELKKPLQLTANEKVDLIAFLRTLNDEDFIFDPKNKFPRNILLTTKTKN
ncbi:cytochrome c peroxidase [Aquimarina addita]|uniref:Cytochrome c peroxidase n=1 Tax=Aquimarina addita TaxID=870485 RepID=A0ABP7XAA0_9FLAO